MPPWFILGTGAVLVYVLTQMDKLTGGRGGDDDSAAGTSGDTDEAGSGSAEGEYVIPGEWLRNVPGYEALTGQQDAAPGDGFGEAYSDGGSGGSSPYGAFNTDIPGYFTDSGTYYFDQAQQGPIDTTVIGVTSEGSPLIDLPRASAPTPAGAYADSVGYAATPSGQIAKSATGKPILE